MGGNAITNAKRIMKEEYNDLCVFFSDKLSEKGIIFHIIQAYETKESFGDMDILIQKDQEMFDFKNFVTSLFEFKEIFKNGDVISCNFNDFQIDFIFESEEDFDFCKGYFSFNDLGNLIGRIAHSLGFKFGHNGVWYCLRDGTHMFGELCLTKDFKTALEFFGFSYERYLQGFTNLIDIFEYVVNSPYFNRDLYPLEHRNHYARMRDRKRKTYNEFLKYCDSLPWEVDYIRYGKEIYLQRAFSLFPDFKQRYDVLYATYHDAQLAKIKFNGELVGEWTGLKGKELGKFISYMKKDFEELSKQWCWTAWVLSTDPRDIKMRTMLLFNFAEWRNHD